MAQSRLRVQNPIIHFFFFLVIIMLMLIKTNVCCANDESVHDNRFSLEYPLIKHFFMLILHRHGRANVVYERGGLRPYCIFLTFFS